jgi:hypothetical protein
MMEKEREWRLEEHFYSNPITGRVQDVFSKFGTILVYGKQLTEHRRFRDVVFEIYEIQRFSVRFYSHCFN